MKNLLEGITREPFSAVAAIVATHLQTETQVDAWLQSTEGEVATSAFNVMKERAVHLLRMLNIGNCLKLKDGAVVDDAMNPFAPILKQGSCIIVPGSKRYGDAVKDPLTRVVLSIPVALNYVGTYIEEDTARRLNCIRNGAIYGGTVILLAFIATLLMLPSWSLILFALTGLFLALRLTSRAKAVWCNWQNYCWSLPLPSGSRGVDFEGKDDVVEPKGIEILQSWTVSLLSIAIIVLMIIRAWSICIGGLALVAPIIGLLLFVVMTIFFLHIYRFMPSTKEQSYWLGDDLSRLGRFEALATAIEKEEDFRILADLLLIAGRLKTPLSNLRFKDIVFALALV